MLKIQTMDKFLIHSLRLQGKIFGDKGYILKDLFSKLYKQGLRLFKGIRKDMKNHLFEIEDKILLRKRSLVESVFNVLKNSMYLEHSGHKVIYKLFSSHHGLYQCF